MLETNKHPGSVLQHFLGGRGVTTDKKVFSFKYKIPLLVPKFYDSCFFRLMLGLAAVPSIIMFFGCLALPESPRWLVSRGHDEKAKKVLVKLRGTSDVSAELVAMKNVCEEEASLSDENSKCA